MKNTSRPHSYKHTTANPTGQYPVQVGKRFETKLDDCDLVLYFYLDENSVGFSLAAVADREASVKGKEPGSPGAAL